MAFSAGKYFNEVAAGRVFIGSTAAAGTAFPISTGTAVTFGIWNNNPGVWAVPLWFGAGFTSGTLALGTIGFANQAVGLQIATGSAMTAFTAGTPKNAVLGAGNNSQISFTPSAATLAAGGTACQWIGGSFPTATLGDNSMNVSYEFDGRIIVPPGQIFFVCGSIAQTALFSMSLAWAEIPKQ